MQFVLTTVSSKGIRTCSRIASAINEVYGKEDNEIIVYIKTAYADDCDFDENVRTIRLKSDDKLDGYIREVFDRASALIFVCAMGIAVRLITPCLRHKSSDPAVLVIDEALIHCIPVLSGHLGGANELAMRLSVKLSCLPVITTASDIEGITAVDMFAAGNKLSISDLDKAGDLTAALLSGERINVINETSDLVNITNLPKGYVYVEESFRDRKDGAGEDPNAKSLRISYRDDGSGMLTLIPRCLTVGVGCRRGTGEDDLHKAIDTCFRENGLFLSAIDKICSIDLKKDEAGIVGLCRRLNREFVTYSPEELNSLAGDFTASAFVDETTGTDNVCERSAMMQGEYLLVKKTVYNGITVAVALRKL